MWKFFDYSKKTSDLSAIIAECNLKIKEPVHVVGHSLGGIIAMYMYNNSNVKSITTLASPIGGIDFHFWTNLMLPNNCFLHDISKHSGIITGINYGKRGNKKPINHLVATKGFSPYIHEQNDGVLTVRSQVMNTVNPIIEVPTNHHEILQHSKTVDFLNTLRD